MNIPKILIFMRLLFAPIILLLAYFVGQRSTEFIVIMMYIGLFSDIFDGIIARKQNISSPELRKTDSRVDLIFWLSIGISSYILYPNLITENMIYVWILLFFEFFIYILSFIRFGKDISTHALLSKFWGITLLIAFTNLIGFGQTGFPFYLCVVSGIISQIDVMLIVLILPRWDHDIPSSYHAYRIRKGKPIKRYKLFNG